MSRPNFLSILLRQIPVAMVALGVVAACALGWFSYQYIYQTITNAQMLALIRPRLVVEFVDPERIRTLDEHFQRLSTLPPIDPATVRDVFNAQPQTPVERKPSGSP